MQSVKFVTRQIGIPSGNGDVISGAELEEYLDFNYFSKGYTLKSEHHLGDARDANGVIVGYQMLFVLVKDEAPRSVMAQAPSV